MKHDIMKNQTEERVSRGLTARSDVGAPAMRGGRARKARIGRLLSALLILSLLLNTFSFTIDDIAFADDVATDAALDDVLPEDIDEEVEELEDVDLTGDDDEEAAADSEGVYTYKIRYKNEVMLSDIVKATKLPIRKMEDIEMVSVLGSLDENDGQPADAIEPLFVEPVTDDKDKTIDFTITAQRFFMKAGLMIFTAEDIYTVHLVRPKDAPKVMENMEIEEPVPPEETPAADEGSAAPLVYEVGEHWPVLFSSVVGALGLPIKPTEVGDLSVSGTADDGAQAVKVEKIDGDYLIIVQRDFKEAALTLYVGDNQYTILLTNGIAAKPTEEQTVEPIEEPAPEPAEKPTEEQTEEPAPEPAEEPTEEQTEEPVPEPAEETTEEQPEEPAPEPAEEPTEEQTEEPAPEPASEPAEQPTEEQPEEQPEEQTEEPAPEPAEQPTEEQPEEQTSEPAEETTEEQPEEPAPEPAEEPTEEQTEEPAPEPAEEPTEATAEPSPDGEGGSPTGETDEVSSEATSEQTKEPTEDQTSEQTEEPTEEPTEATAEPSPDGEGGSPTGETDEVSSEPTSEQTEEPTEEPTTEAPEESTDEPTEATAEPSPDGEGGSPTGETDEVSSEPTSEQTEESTEDQTSEQTEEPTEESITEPIEEPYEEPAAQPAEEPAPVVAYPAQTFTGRTARVRVTATAGEGAFPEGTTMKLRPVLNRDTLSEFADAVDDDFLEVRSVYAVDIAFYDADGNEIEPLQPISVVMTVNEIDDQQEALVVHMDDEGDTQIVEQSDAPQSVGNKLTLNVEMPAGEEQTEVSNEQTEVGNETALAFDAEGFSLYAVVVADVIQTRYIDAAGHTYNIEVGYGADADIPSGAGLRVSEVTGAAADDYAAQAAEALNVTSGQMAYAKALDIAIVKDGEEFQPQAPVSVSIKLLDAPEASEDINVSVLHFGEEVEPVECALEGDSVTFEADGFSVYVVTYTVDFHWGDYVYSISGESDIRLSELLDKLNVREIALPDVDGVTFTDPMLVAVDPLDGDWLLTSLAPFDTDEALVLTLRNGQSVEIKVTDAVTTDTTCPFCNDFDVTGWEEKVIPAASTSDNNASKLYWKIENNCLYIHCDADVNASYSERPWDSTENRSNVTSAVVSGNISRIYKNMFLYMYGIGSFQFDCPNIQTIEGGAFQDTGRNATQLVRLDFSGCQELTTIKANAFYNCFTSNKYAVDFSNCTNLKTIEAKAFRETDKNKLQTADFSGCTNLDTINTDAFNWPNSIANWDLSGTAISAFTTGWYHQDELNVLNLFNCPNLTLVDLSKLNNRQSSRQPVDVYLPANPNLEIRLPSNASKLGTIYFQGTAAEAAALFPNDYLSKVVCIQTITITAGSQTQVYNGSALTLAENDYAIKLQGVDVTAASLGLPDGYSLTVAASGSQTDVGTGTSRVNVTLTPPQGDAITVTNGYTLDCGDGGSYNFVLETGTLEVKPKAITVSPKAKYYGQPDQVTITGMVEGEDESQIAYTISEHGEDAGTYNVTITGEALQGNYSVTYEDGTLTINPAPVTLTGNSGYFEYDGAEHTVSGFTSSEEGLTFDGVSASGSGTDMGSYPVSFSGVTVNETKDTTGNYVVGATVDGTLTITRLLNKEFLGVTGNRAGYKLTINPDKLTLNGGEPITLKDTLRDKKSNPGVVDQSFEYASIDVETDPAGAAVSYDFRSYTGTYVIPDRTKVVITYTTRVLGDAGVACTFGNDAVLLDKNELRLAEDHVEETLTVYPSASDVTGSTSEGMVKLYVYGDGHMETGIAGAQFILLDANQRPMTFKKGDHAGEGVTFTTGADGYTDVQLASTDGDISIQKNTPYYLEMIKAPAGYKRDSTLYSFMITDDPSYNSGGVWTYYNGDTMKVRLYPEEASLNVSMRFSGNYTLPGEDQNAIEVVLQKKNADGSWSEVERHAYSDFSYGSMTFNTGKAEVPFEAGATYRVIQENEKPWSLPNTIITNTRYYLIIGSGDSQNGTEPFEFVVSADQLAGEDQPGTSFNIIINNEYEEPKLVLTKMNKQTGDRLPGAKFTVKKASDDSVVATYTTAGDNDPNGVAKGEIVITGGEAFEAETLYYVVETEAPAGYLLAVNPEKVYFYFCNDKELEESIKASLPKGETAVNLLEDYDSRTIDNQQDLLTIPVIKTWLGNRWPEEVASVVVGLHSAVGDQPVSITLNDDGTFTLTEVEDDSQAVVKNASGNPLQVELVSGAPYIREAFKRLPPRDESNQPITYSLVEEHVWQKVDEGENPADLLDDYVKEYGISNSGIYVVRNREATTLTVNKTWVDAEGNPVSGEVLAAQSDVTFDVYRTTTAIDGSEITNEGMTAALSGLEPVRIDLGFEGDSTQTTVRELEKTDDYGRRYYYYVLESVPSFGDEKYLVAADGSITIQNPVAPETTTLTVTKTVAKDPRVDSGNYNPDFWFTLTLTKGSRVIRSYTVKDGAEPIVTNKNGQARFSLKNGGSIVLTLPVGVIATLTEDVDSEYETAASSDDATDLLPADARVFRYDVTLDRAVTVAYTNTLHVVCKVVDANGVAHPFESLKSALAYIRSGAEVFDENNVATIQMLEDYAMPATDVFDVREGEHIKLTTAGVEVTDSFPFTPSTEGATTAVITRAGNGGSLLTNAGTLTLDNIVLDGAKGTYSAVETNGGLVYNAGTLNLGSTVTLRNSAVGGEGEDTGKGGAIYTTGTVTLSEGSSITGNTANSGAAVYLEAGTLNIVGGANGVTITGNNGANDGAVVVKNADATINLSGKAVVYDNLNAQSAQANICMLADSSTVLHVADPGLAADAKIGVRARDGYRMIGDQFAHTDFGFTEHLGTFINDEFGYKGELKSGTSMTVAWKGHALKITKAVEGSGDDPSDTFTIVVTSDKINRTSYAINGTIHYEIKQAGRTPGSITLTGIKANDEVTISPLPVGSYTVTEEGADNYDVTVSAKDKDEHALPVAQGGFSLAGDTDVTVTNTRKTATVELLKTLDDPLIGANEKVGFNFTVKLTEADGTPIKGYPIGSQTATDDQGGTITTNIATDPTTGEATFTLSPTRSGDDALALTLPVGANLQITETVNSDYRITTSAVTVPADGGEAGTAIPDGDSAENVVAFPVSQNARVTFANVRKMATITLSKDLVNKVSEPESFAFNIVLLREDSNPAVNYVMNSEKNIQTDENGVATITLSPAQPEPDDTTGGDSNGVILTDSLDSDSVVLRIPEGTKLTVVERFAEGESQNAARAARYNTTVLVNGEAPAAGTRVAPSDETPGVVLSPVVESDTGIAFTNARKMQAITVTNTVSGYSGNVQAFHYTVTVQDGDETQAYNARSFKNGVYFEGGTSGFDLTTGQSRTLTVPYGATLNIEQGFVVGYDNSVAYGGSTYQNTRTVSNYYIQSNDTIAFTNKQLIGMRLVNNTGAVLNNVTVQVGYPTVYRVNDTRDDQERLDTVSASGKYKVTLDVPVGETLLEIEHGNKIDSEQPYAVSGLCPAANYYYTIDNEPSYHEFADPAVLHIYSGESLADGQREFEVKGKLRYSTTDSTITFTVQPLVSYDVNGGAWTTEMDGYHDADGSRQVYQYAVNTGDPAPKPTDPVYPTAENVTFLGWYDKNGVRYDFDSQSNAVTEPLTLIAHWSKPANETKTVTLENGLGGDLTVTVKLTQNGSPVANHALVVTGGVTVETDANGQATITLTDTVNLYVPNGAKLELTVSPSALGVSSQFNIVSSGADTYAINSVTRDGTVSFTGGICKITDGTHDILYDASGNPTVYATLSSAFTAYSGTLYTDPTQQTVATPTRVEMLVDEYTIQQSAALTLPANLPMTLTTASSGDEHFPYVGVRTRATIYRSAAGKNNNCFTLSAGGDITLDDIILDGGSTRGVKVASGKEGALVMMTGGTLTIKDATLRNVEYVGYGSNANGGAVYLTGGQLNVKGGARFSNLYARRGGAICAITDGQLSIAGTGICFENCQAKGTDNDSDGGAIYYGNTASALTINGGSDKDDPGIVFEACATNGSKGSGGAIYAVTAQSISVSGCGFTECRAKTTEANINGAYGGGAISAWGGNDKNGIEGLTVTGCTFVDCDSLSRGGAIVAYMKNGATASITSSTFEDCSCKGQGGAVATYQPGQGNASPSNGSDTTTLTTNDCSFTNCSSGTDNGSGGAIQCYLPCMDFTDTDFTNCWAGKEGGAVNNYFADNYNRLWAGSYMTLTRCTFTNCRAEDRFEVDSVIHYGGAVNTKVKTATVTGCTFVDCVSTLRDGGALHLGGCGAGTSATISGSTFTGCSAKRHGGAVFSSAETLTIKENSKFIDCTSTVDLGGAVYHGMNCRTEANIKKETTISDCEFNGCGAAINGGAVWTAAQKAGITGCTMENCTAGNHGGAVYFSSHDIQNSIDGSRVETKLTPKPVSLLQGQLARGFITNGTITGCKAAYGGAVFVGSSACFSGELDISGNTVSDINGGAISAGDANARLYFEGKVRVEENACSVDNAYPHNVALNNDSNAVINTTSNGLVTSAQRSAYIGVYTTDTKNVYSKHGQETQPFGTYAASNGNANLDCFVNDRDSGLTGYHQLTGSDYSIYWGTYLCKITDADGNTLTRFNGKDAVYQRLTVALDDFDDIPGAVYIKMLVPDYEIQQPETISNFPAKTVTLSTATTNEPDGKYPFRPYPGNDTNVCVISRSNSTNPLFTLTNANATFALEDITLDGRKNKSTTTGNYRLIVATAGKVVVNPGTTLQYGQATDDYGGGAIWSTSDSTEAVTVNGKYDASRNDAQGRGATIRFIHCRTTNTDNSNKQSNGGAIKAKNLTITNSNNDASQQTRDYPGTAFIDCYGRRGGAICVNGNTLDIAGVFCRNCESYSTGGAFYHDSLNNDFNQMTTKVAHSRFENCRAVSDTDWAAGGAFNSNAAIMEVRDCFFEDCRAKASGGAISHGSAGDDGANRVSTLIEDTTFKSCIASGSNKDNRSYGGSVYTRAKVVTITGCEFLNSTAYNHGGALYCQNNAKDVDGVTISGTTFTNCTVTRNGGQGGAIDARSKRLTLQDSDNGKHTRISNCTAKGFSGAVHMDADSTNTGLVLNIQGKTSITGCYANKGGAIYLKNGATMNLSDTPSFKENGFNDQSNTTDGSCIYLEQGSKLVFKPGCAPVFDRNIHSTVTVTNGSDLMPRRQDIFLAGFAGTNIATSIEIAGDLGSGSSVIWVWPEKDPHRKVSQQFAMITAPNDVSDVTLGRFRNALDDSVTGCSKSEFLAGVHLNNDSANAYWSKMYDIEFRKRDNKDVAVPGAEFTLYTNKAMTVAKQTAVSSSSTGDDKGLVKFISIPVGVYYMKETGTPESFRVDDSAYVVVVGTPAFNDDALWTDEHSPFYGVSNAEQIVRAQTTEIEQPFGVFKLDDYGKAILYTKNNKVDPHANLAGPTAAVVNERVDYSSCFKKVDHNGNGLAGASFTIYAQSVDDEGNDETLDNGYPVLELWSRDGENYPDPVESADGTGAYKDAEDTTLPKGVVYIKELPIGTYYLRETDYPKRNANSRITFYVEEDRLFRLEIEGTNFTLSERQENGAYAELPKDAQGVYYTVSNTEAVCKLTDGSGNLLYRLGADGEPLPALYPTLNAAFEDAAATGGLCDAKGNPVSPAALMIQMLQDVTLTEPITYAGSTPLTLTTADRNAKAGDEYVFYTNRTSDVSRAEIKRGKNGSAPLFTVDGDASFTLKNINLNGQKKQGRAVHVVQGSLAMQSDAMIRQFKATGDLEGGAAVLLEDGTSLTVNGGSSLTAQFANNEAGGDGGAIAAGSGCTINIQNAQFTGNKSADGNGGALALKDVSEDQADQDPVVINNAVFKTNTAGQDGGAIAVGEYRKLTIRGSASLTNNRAANGGAVYAGPASEVTIQAGTLRGNTASANGGAVYVDAKNDKAGSLIVEGGSITGNSAVLGGAVYVQDKASMTMSGGSVTGNSASDNEGGAINVGGEDARLNFSGNPKVYDNPGKTGQQKNVVLHIDTNEIIHVVDEMGAKAKIGVYTTEAVRSAHGLPGMPFGTYDDPAYINNLNTFINDIEDEFGHPFGTTGEEAGTLYWREYIVRVKATGGTWTYHEYLCTTTEQGLEKTGAFDQANALDGDVIVETLLETHDRYTLPSPVAFEKDRTVTLRTTQESQWNAVGFDTAITRGAGYDSASMFTVNDGNLTVTKITLDGDKTTNTAVSANGGLVRVSGGGLTIADGATLQNSETAGCGGAVYVEKMAKFTMTGGTIQQNAAKIGGGVCVTRHSDNAENSNQNAREKSIAISGGQFSDNAATTCGGGLMIGEGNVAEIRNLTMIDNKAERTEASGAFDGIDGNVIADHTDYLYGSGGAIFADRTTVIRMNACTIGQNGHPNTASSSVYSSGIHEYVGGSGGGIFLYSTPNYADWKSAKLYMEDTTLQYNEALYGGGIGTINASHISVEDCDIVNNTASSRGGGILSRSESTTILVTRGEVRGNTATDQGGGIWTNGNAPEKVVLTEVSVTNNTAKEGGGVYAGMITTKNTQITGNWTTNADSEGPLIDGAGGMYLTKQLVIDDAVGKEPTHISDNKTAQGRRLPSDLHLPYDQVTKINKAKVNGAYIDSVVLNSAFNGKLYVTNPGKVGSDFGTAADGNDDAYKDYEDVADWDKANIVSENDSMFYGRRGHNGNDRTLYWHQEFVCQITTGLEDGDILYYKQDDVYFKAAYMKLYNKNNEDKHETAIGTLNDPNFTLYRRNGDEYVEYTGNDFWVEMLVDYGVNVPVYVNSGLTKNITLTTALPRGDARLNGKDKFGYRVAGKTAATIAPGSSMGVLNRNGEAFMFRLVNSRFKVQNITLDGGVKWKMSGNSVQFNGNTPLYEPDSFISKKDGFLFQMTEASQLTLGDGATLQNAYTTHMWGGGAICFGQSTNGAQVTLEEGSRIYRCYSGDTDHPNNTGDYGGTGGAIAISKAGATGNNTVTIKGGTIEQCWASRNGGAIYVSNKVGHLVIDVDEGNTFVMKDCRAPVGGGICLNDKGSGGDLTPKVAASMEIEGSVSFSGNYGTDYSLSGQLNGTDATWYSHNGWARQDIFFNNLPWKNDSDQRIDPVKPIVVTGAINAGEGGICVWVNQYEHNTSRPPFMGYQYKDHFAVFDTDVKDSLEAGDRTNKTTLLTDTMKAFRNARTDADTGNTTKTYLTGVLGDGTTEHPLKVGDYDYIYWGIYEEGFDFSFMKIDSYGDPLPGATFALYTDQQCTQPLMKGETAVTATSASGLETGTNAVKDEDGNTVEAGVVYFAKLQPNAAEAYYYMVETAAPEGYVADPTVYQVQIASDGTPTVMTTAYTATVTTSGGTTTVAVTADATITPAEVFCKLIPRKDVGGNPVLDDEGKPVNDKQYQIMNRLNGGQRVILRKASQSGDTYTALPGAHFKIYRADMTEVTDGQPLVGETPKGYYESGPTGVYFSGLLPFGTYYLLEIKAPDGTGYTANAGKVFKLEVKPTGMTGPTEDATKKVSGANAEAITTAFVTLMQQPEASTDSNG